MTMLLVNHMPNTGVLTRLAERVEKGVCETLTILKAQQDSWQRYQETPVGRRVSRRAWMRHGAMLEQLGRQES